MYHVRVIEFAVLTRNRGASQCSAQFVSIDVDSREALMEHRGAAVTVRPRRKMRDIYHYLRS